MEPNEKDRLVSEWLNDALKQFGQAEPRPGLEGRVLASLRAESEREVSRRWQWWPAVVAVTAILTIVVGVFLARSGRHNPQPPIAGKISVPVKVRPTQMNHSPVQAANRETHTRVHGHPRRADVELASGKQEQFPSPEPLSEQEKILARYVRQFPHEADLTAQAQAELARQDMLAEQSPPESQISSTSEAQNQ